MHAGLEVRRMQHVLVLDQWKSCIQASKRVCDWRGVRGAAVEFVGWLESGPWTGREILAHRTCSTLALLYDLYKWQ
jgi:hypothetical protein